MSESEKNTLKYQLTEAEVKEYEERTEMLLEFLDIASPNKLDLERNKVHSGLKLVAKRSPTIVKPFSFQTRIKNKESTKKEDVSSPPPTGSPQNVSNRRRSLSFNGALPNTNAIHNSNLSETCSGLSMGFSLAQSGVKFMKRKSTTTTKPFSFDTRANNKQNLDMKESCVKSKDIPKKAALPRNSAAKSMKKDERADPGSKRAATARNSCVTPEIGDKITKSESEEDISEYQLLEADINEFEECTQMFQFLDIGSPNREDAASPSPTGSALKVTKRRRSLSFNGVLPKINVNHNSNFSETCSGVSKGFTLPHSGLKFMKKKNTTTMKPFSFDTREKNKQNLDIKESSVKSKDTNKKAAVPRNSFAKSIKKDEKKDPGSTKRTPTARNSCVTPEIGDKNKGAASPSPSPGSTLKVTKRRRSLSFNGALPKINVNRNSNLCEACSGVSMGFTLPHSGLKFANKKGTTTMMPFSFDTRAKNKQNLDMKESCVKSKDIPKKAALPRNSVTKSIKKDERADPGSTKTAATTRNSCVTPEIGYTNRDAASPPSQPGSTLKVTKRRRSLSFNGALPKTNVNRNSNLSEACSGIGTGFTLAQSGSKFMKSTTTMKPFSFDTRAKNKQCLDVKESCVKPNATSRKTASPRNSDAKFTKDEKEDPGPSKRIATNRRSCETSKTLGKNVCSKESSLHSGVKFVPKRKETVVKPFSFDRKPKKPDSDKKS